jgi:hypothetical protein
MQLKLVTAAALACALVLAAAPANARWGHHHHGWGGGAAGFAAGALIGSTLASPYYYGPPAYAYDSGPDYAGGDAEAYCEQRFRSYDPASGTYAGYDGRRHPCP